MNALWYASHRFWYWTPAAFLECGLSMLRQACYRVGRPRHNIERCLTCLVAKGHELLQVLKLSCSDALPASEREYRQSDCGAPPQMLMAEGAVLLNNDRCWRSSVFLVTCSAVKAHYAVLPNLQAIEQALASLLRPMSILMCRFI